MTWVKVAALVLVLVVSVPLLAHLNQTYAAFEEIGPGHTRMVRLRLRNFSYAVWRWQFVMGVALLLMGGWTLSAGAMALMGLGGGMWALTRFIEHKTGSPQVFPYSLDLKPDHLTNIGKGD